MGPAAFFTDSRLNLTISDYVDCVYEQLDTLYEAGARNFVLLNIAPLNYAPMYALPENGGTIGSNFWKDESTYNTNATQVSEKMRQYVALVNSIYKYRTPDEVEISDRYPESSFTIFDVHSLVRTTPNIITRRGPRVCVICVLLTSSFQNTDGRYLARSRGVPKRHGAVECDFNDRGLW